MHKDEGVGAGIGRKGVKEGPPGAETLNISVQVVMTQLTAVNSARFITVISLVTSVTPDPLQEDWNANWRKTLVFRHLRCERKTSSSQK